MAFDFFADQEDKDRGWMIKASCSDAPANIFFLENEPAATKAQVAKARALCDVCPVQVRCLEYALNNKEHYGIWGGKSPRERREMLRERRRLEQGL